MHMLGCVSICVAYIQNLVSQNELSSSILVDALLYRKANIAHSRNPDYSKIGTTSAQPHMKINVSN